MMINLKLIKGWIEEVGRKEFKRDSLKKKEKKFEKKNSYFIMKHREFFWSNFISGVMIPRQISHP